MRAALAPLTTTGTLIATEYETLKQGVGRTARIESVFEASRYDPAAVARARRLWSERMVNEYTSTTVFTQLAAQLMETNAPLDATAVTLRMAQDELRHAEICGRVVEALGGSSRVMRETGIAPIARHPGCGDEERALRNVIFTTCLSEMNSVSYFVTVLERMKDPYLRDVTRALLADEVLHGRFGFVYLESRADWLAARPDVRASVGRYLRYAFAFVEREFTAGEGGATRAPTADDDALGVVPVGLSAAVFRDTMLAAVVPGLERFDIPAEDAWKHRSLG